MIVYPDNLPAPLLDGYAQKRTSNLLRTTMASGRARQRKRFVTVPTELSASWRCQADTAAVFEGFVTHELNDGADWFVMDVLTPLGMVAHTVRFISHPLEDCKPIGPRTWEYRARLEIKQRGVLDAEIYPTIRDLHTSGDLGATLDALEDAVNNNQLTGE